MSFRYEALHSYFHAYGIGIMYPYKPYHGTKAEMTEKPRTYYISFPVWQLHFYFTSYENTFLTNSKMQRRPKYYRHGKLHRVCVNEMPPFFYSNTQPCNCGTVIANPDGTRYYPLTSFAGKIVTTCDGTSTYVTTKYCYEQWTKN